MLDALTYVTVRVITFLLNLLPLSFRIAFVRFLLKLAMQIAPKHERIARRNLELAFPEYDQVKRDEILERAYTAFARLVVDSLRLPSIDRAWAKAHVDFPHLAAYQEAKRQNPHTGVVLATGHLGSFDLMGYCVPLLSHNISFVVRNFKLPLVDRWWNAIRERHGNGVIARKGAINELIHTLQSGRDVAILFDQNVTRKHAVFVDFFGRPAATTKAVAIAALRTKAPVLVAGMQYLGDDRYSINTELQDFAALYDDDSIPYDEKVQRITAVVSKRFEMMVRKAPEEWFWMHRRWRTREDPTAPSLY